MTENDYFVECLNDIPTDTPKELSPVLVLEMKVQNTHKKFGDLKKGDKFRYDKDVMIKTCRIKAGNDGAFYTAVSIVTGNHYCIADDLEVYV